MSEIKKIMLSYIIGTILLLFYIPFLNDEKEKEVSIIKNAVYSTYKIFSPDHAKLGSSVVVLEPGLIITAEHVLKENHEFFQITHPRTKKLYTAKVERRFKEVDLAILSAPVECPCATVAEKYPENFSKVFRVGYLGSMGIPSITEGRVSGYEINKFKKDSKYDVYTMFSTAAASPGFSGGGLFNQRGELIGITRSIKLFGNIGNELPNNHLVNSIGVKEILLALNCFRDKKCEIE